MLHTDLKKEQLAWLSQPLSVQVTFLEWSQDGMMRHPKLVSIEGCKPYGSYRQRHPDDRGTGDSNYESRQTALAGSRHYQSDVSAKACGHLPVPAPVLPRQVAHDHPVSARSRRRILLSENAPEPRLLLFRPMCTKILTTCRSTDCRSRSGWGTWSRLSFTLHCTSQAQSALRMDD